MSLIYMVGFDNMTSSTDVLILTTSHTFILKKHSLLAKM